MNQQGGEEKGRGNDVWNQGSSHSLIKSTVISKSPGRNKCRKANFYDRSPGERLPPPLEPLGGVSEQLSECASCRDRHVGPQSRESRPSPGQRNARYNRKATARGVQTRLMALEALPRSVFGGVASP